MTELIYKPFRVLSSRTIKFLEDAKPALEENTNSPGSRLREELENLFGSVARAVHPLGLQSQGQLSPYLADRSQIGIKMRSRLEAVGVDVGYVLTGRRSIPASATPPEEIKPVYPPEVEKMIEEIAESAFQSAKLWGPKELSPSVEKALRKLTRKIAEEKVTGKKQEGS